MVFDRAAFLLRNCFDREIAAFDVNIGSREIQEIRGAEFVEDEDAGDGFERGQAGGASGGGIGGAPGALALADPGGPGAPQRGCGPRLAGGCAGR